MKLFLPALLNSLFLPLIPVSRAQDDPRSAIGAENPHLHVRRGLISLKKRLEVDRECHVAFLGGSITQNTRGHTAMVPAWLRKAFPDAEVTVTNAGLGSTCSTSGAFRLKPHIFGKEKVDLLVVEFAVNDDQDAGHARRGDAQHRLRGPPAAAHGHCLAIRSKPQTQKIPTESQLESQFLF